MPGLLDDAIIKRRILNANLRALIDEAQHIKTYGMLAECQDLDDKLRAAYVPFRDTLQEVLDETERRVSKKAIALENSHKTARKANNARVGRKVVRKRK